MTLEKLVERGLVEENRPLAGMTTYKFGGAASWYAEVGTRSELEAVAGVRGVPLVVLGRGSNVVVSDSGYDGLVVKLGGEFNRIGFGVGTAEAGGAVSLPRLARACAAAGRGGLEWYVGIPGSVGGAVVMNAGGHGSDTAEWLIQASILDVTTGRITDETPEDLELSYRHSRLGANHIVFHARFRTEPRAREECEAMMRDVTAWRRTHQPGGTFNAGSVFKNPPGDAAGRLIDSVGLKGFRVGGVAVSERHANFFVADDEACAQDVFDLVGAVQLRVHEATGVVLEPEIRFIGDFGGAT